MEAPASKEEVPRGFPAALAGSAALAALVGSGAVLRSGKETFGPLSVLPVGSAGSEGSAFRKEVQLLPNAEYRAFSKVLANAEGQKVGGSRSGVDLEEPDLPERSGEARERAGRRALKEQEYPKNQSPSEALRCRYVERRNTKRLGRLQAEEA